jgi:hypothetical protein
MWLEASQTQNQWSLKMMSCSDVWLTLCAGFKYQFAYLLNYNNKSSPPTDSVLSGASPIFLNQTLYLIHQHLLLLWLDIKIFFVCLTLNNLSLNFSKLFLEVFCGLFKL